MSVAIRTATADEDLRGIALQIGIESGRPRTAERVIDELLDCCDRLADLSNISRHGTATPEIGHDIRLLHVRRWVIIFRYTDSGVLILRFADGSQDYMTWRFE